MITNAITDYLNNPSVSLNDKKKLVQNCDLTYSDYFELMKLYKHDAVLVSHFKYCVYPGDSKLEAKIKTSFKKIDNRLKLKRMSRAGKRWNGNGDE